MKIYTKTGDKGTTELIGGRRVPKSHIRIEAYGTIDELIAYIGLIRDQDIEAKHRERLIQIQDKLMVCASLVAADEGAENRKLPDITPDDVLALEKYIDEMESGLPPMRCFVLPGGHTTVSYCHIARTVCRRAERQLIRLQQELSVDERALVYINRLSDYLFMLSRRLSNDLNATEIPWITKL
jgi:cob(I)alamin adenosyltransferase